MNLFSRIHYYQEQVARQAAAQIPGSSYNLQNQPGRLPPSQAMVMSRHLPTEIDGSLDRMAMQSNRQQRRPSVPQHYQQPRPYGYGVAPNQQHPMVAQQQRPTNNGYQRPAPYPTAIPQQQAGLAGVSHMFGSVMSRLFGGQQQRQQSPQSHYQARPVGDYQYNPQRNRRPAYDYQYNQQANRRPVYDYQYNPQQGRRPVYDYNYYYN